MKMSYKKLWKKLIDEGMNKSTLRMKAGISSSSFRKYIGCSVGIKHCLKCLIGTVPIIIVYKIGIQLHPGSIIMQLIQIIVSGILYFLVLFLLKDEVLVSGHSESNRCHFFGQ